MENNLQLIKIKDIEKKVAKKTQNEYMRVKFIGAFKEPYKGVDKNTEITVSTSMSLDQWVELATAMKVSVEKLENFDQKLVTEKMLLLTFDFRGEIKNKPLLERKVGTMNGYNYDYWELHNSVLIQNGVMTSSFKKDYTSFFEMPEDF